ncbi:hypothetical protein DPMN_093905 [Dreissena polymorpha]|uniref:Uncharacterized protein n=1 Tax=Dreissena polymorpha TaxID=45954 RepID=A0A9D4L448_DREPO|nr:hypothetical protein DPMN_093905 [Dreissena polymorpha]
MNFLDRPTDRPTDRLSDSYIAPITNGNGIKAASQVQEFDSESEGVSPPPGEKLKFQCQPLAKKPGRNRTEQYSLQHGELIADVSDDGVHLKIIIDKVATDIHTP